MDINTQETHIEQLPQPSASQFLIAEMASNFTIIIIVQGALNIVFINLLSSITEKAHHRCQLGFH